MEGVPQGSRSSFIKLHIFGGKFEQSYRLRPRLVILSD